MDQSREFISANTATDDTRPPISVYIRTLNEADRLGPVLDAANKVAREIVVVDSGSRDATVAVAEAAGAKVLHNPWPGNGYQKRIGEEACVHDWLLDLDGDEVLDEDLIAAIQDLFAAGEPPNPVYALKLVTVPPVGAPWHNFMLAWRNKLYDRRVHRMPESATWDQLALSKTKAVPRLDGAILHYSFRNLRDISEKFNRSSSARAAGTKRRSLWHLRMRVWFAFPVYLFKAAILRGAIRGGTYGLAIAVILAHARWLRDAKMYEAERFAHYVGASGDSRSPDTPTG